MRLSNHPQQDFWTFHNPHVVNHGGCREGKNHRSDKQRTRKVVLDIQGNQLERDQHRQRLITGANG